MNTLSKNQAYEMTVSSAYKWSVFAFLSFIGLFLTFPLLKIFPDIIYLSSLLAVAFHVGILPLVLIIPAPTWTKIGGFTWVAADIILVGAGLNGIPLTTVESFRSGVHIMLVIWPIGIAMVNSGFLKWSSIGFAITTGVIPLFGGLLSPQVRFIGLPFILMWWIAVILYLKRHKNIMVAQSMNHVS